MKPLCPTCDCPVGEEGASCPECAEHLQQEAEWRAELFRESLEANSMPEVERCR